MKENRGGAEQKRKTRSDKKVAVAPNISDNYRVWIHRLARRLEIPEGEVGTKLVKAALDDEKCIEFFRTYFHRSYRIHENHIMYPLFKPANIYDYLDMDMDTDRHSRFKLKFSKSIAEQLTEFQIALGISFFAHGVKALLEYSLSEPRIIQKVVPGVEFPEPKKTLSSENVNINPNPNVWSIFK
ncbi:hypothetical protein BK120_23395 [Paenibacillus sp. FSL A5-0031]|uniref:hypothetical protein n=1 Tax=Paenibacillus sp. FSL A5-0031 TaxID=1920420 RepID=UPI00096D16FE|nr:hypothetical protein [Paenibacillus sp. FSL A5-0031]OME78687.1 hypothetical protein BK120_23395 [Paenibacillus sp. FSL A5-0031]